MMKKIFRSLQILPRHYGTSVITLISASMLQSLTHCLATKQMAGKNPGHFSLDTVAERQAWLATALPSAACAAASRAIGTR